MQKQQNRYLVATNGLAGKAAYSATDPDEALMFAHRHERFLRVIKCNPTMLPVKAMQIAKDEMDMPDFRIDFCILENSR